MVTCGSWSLKHIIHHLQQFQVSRVPLALLLRSLYRPRLFQQRLHYRSRQLLRCPQLTSPVQVSRHCEEPLALQLAAILMSIIFLDLLVTGTMQLVELQTLCPMLSLMFSGLGVSPSFLCTSLGQRCKSGG